MTLQRLQAGTAAISPRRFLAVSGSRDVGMGCFFRLDKANFQSDCRFGIHQDMTNLGNMITAFQQKHDVENREMARQIGINASTLSRLKQGKLPDAEGLAKIILWMTKE